ncbi:hypothetical protein BpHYR1_002724 [Brachionus plicatilis]|uniref:Uncharacterized protein n=1 Tax=Brachionus plicatilis TaxID=10195 RepID=A0A3M7QAW2_BRAPC|nr:hypothetical protein BpHYR1_002724 [Brachionus plicatilis]
MPELIIGTYSTLQKSTLLFPFSYGQIDFGHGCISINRRSVFADIMEHNRINLYRFFMKKPIIKHLILLHIKKRS